MNASVWHTCCFYFFALIACGFAVAVVASHNIVRMAWYLVVALGAVAGLFFLAGADFLGAVQLLVYVGGTMVLLVFGVMLTARGSAASMKVGGLQWLLAILIAGALLAVLLPAALRISPAPGTKTAEVQTTSAPLGMGLLGVRVDRLEKGSELFLSDPPEERSQKIVLTPFSGYLLVFEILSIHLLVVLIGAAYLARAGSRNSQSTTNDKPE
jgi:NADH-quinone oxidoreductase subunit J